ncbi:excinuclease ABC subunit UvrA [Lentilactobacillus senioris]|uniref:excinuclease ABC subunit UvrA n=1 Tax=Lentilactobacillus senioris TaxID=931534 RepID=UPI0022816E62|nr:excinuclease ABC subunit UvrA [Lentilactobacillus senioris]MCY9806423.1 excinuclease ABC subunit UvrA [Lentilactobacillus senioris]
MTSKLNVADHIEVRGGNVNNLKNIDVDIPLHQFVAISGLSGSGKSSLAMGILYSEGARRYLDALATYTRRRISQFGRADVKSVKHIPSALALRQRPSVPGVRSTVGTMTEVYNVLRLIYSRLGSPKCPNGHQVPPTIEIAEAMDKTGEAMGRITCPTCGVEFYAYGAEDFAFNSDGACPECDGLGVTKQLDPSKLIDNPDKSIEDGAVAAWRIPGRNFMPSVARSAGIRIDIPFKDLSDKEKDFVLHGPNQTIPVDIPSKNGRVFHMDNAIYENAYNAVTDSMATTKSEVALKRLNRFYRFSTCPTCHGTRLNPNRLTQLVNGQNIAEVSALPLAALPAWVAQAKEWLPENMLNLANNLTGELVNQLQPLLDLGLDYLTMDRAGSSLSTGELQRIQLGRTLRTETTGVLYVLDEPSVGLHPDNVAGLIKIFHQLIEQGNSVIVVDHETSIIDAADWIIEIGPGSGAAGGQVIAQGTPAEIKRDPQSLIGPFLTGKAPLLVRKPIAEAEIMANGSIDLTVEERFNLHNVNVQIPLNRLTAVTGFSGAGKTTLILDSLLPALTAQAHGEKLPDHVIKLDAAAINNLVSVDAVPVGKNARSTVATYTNIMDELRKLYAKQPLAKQKQFTPSYFSYNNKQGACPTCGGTGEISLDIQYLPDMVEVCPTCHGKRFNPDVLQVKWQSMSIADVLDLEVDKAQSVLDDNPKIMRTLTTLTGMGLGYLKLGEATPTLSGGEAQRLKLTTHLAHQLNDSLFIFDEPTVGLHPLDVQTLLRIFDQLLANGATVITITHDLDLIANADYMIDMGPKGGDQGGRIMAAGSPLKLVQEGVQSLTLKYLRGRVGD